VAETDIRALFLEELAAHVDRWTEAARKAMDTGADLTWTDDETPYRRLGELLGAREANADFVTVVREVLYGCIHTTLTTLEGGTRLAESGTLDLVDENGQSLLGGLDELFISHLVATGRIKEIETDLRP
jgi:hypothetical protein